MGPCGPSMCTRTAKRVLAPTLPVLVISHSRTSSSTCARGGRAERRPCRHGQRKHTSAGPSPRQQGVGGSTPREAVRNVLLRQCHNMR